MEVAASGKRVLKGNVRRTLAAGSTEIRMLLVAALLCASVLAAGAAQFVDCVCSGGVCTCNIPRWGPIDNICHMQQKGNTCFQVSQDSSSRDGKARKQSCTCESTQCTCEFGKVLEGDQICSKSSKDTTCTAARILEDYRLASTVDCVCSGGVCTCNIPRFHPIENICHAHQEENTCFKVLHSSDYTKVKEGCSCESTQCTCKFGRVSEGDQICSKSAEDTTCYTASVSEEGNTENKHGCTCSGGVCHCPFLQRPKTVKRICLDPRVEPCLPVKEVDKLGAIRLPDDQGCICSAGQCVCHFKNVVRRGKICFETPTGVECVPVIKSTEETDDAQRGGLFEKSKPEPVPILPIHEKKCTEIEGKPVATGVFRYVVALVLIEKDTKKFVCSGSLVTSQTIITAAHCVRQSHGKYWAIAGSKDLSVHEASEQRRRVVEQIPHRNYYVTKNVHHNDVAVFIVYSPFIMNTFIQPANMEITRADKLYLLVTGWGNVQDHPPAKDELHFTTSMVVPRTLCLNHIPHLDDHSMCVRSGKEEERGCLGDHGSGAMIGDSIVGIVSWLHLTDKSGFLVMMNVTRYKDFFSTYIT